MSPKSLARALPLTTALLLVLTACQPSATPDAPVATTPDPTVTPDDDEDPGLPPEVDHDLLDDRARQAWIDIANVPHRCGAFDYLPNGGMYTMYCRLKNFGSFAELEDALGISIFVSGPHTGGQLDVHNPNAFGHYNPDFVLGLTSWALPGLKDSAFQQRTQSIYDHYFRPLARTYWATYRKLSTHDDFWDQEQVAFSQAVATGNTLHYHEQFFYFMNPRFLDNPRGGFEYFVDRGFDGGVFDGNVVKTAVGFWIRRGIDETAHLFGDALQVLMETYDHQFVEQTL